MVWLSHSLLSSMKRFYSVEFTLFAIFYRQIIISSFKIYELKNVGSAAKYFLFLLCRSTEFRHIFSGLLSFFLSLSIYQHQHFIKLFCSVMLVSGFASWWYRYYCRGLHTFPANQYFQYSKFMTCLRFQNIFLMFFFLSFISFPKGLTKPVPEE